MHKLEINLGDPMQLYYSGLGYIYKSWNCLPFMVEEQIIKNFEILKRKIKKLKKNFKHEIKSGI